MADVNPITSMSKEKRLIKLASAVNRHIQFVRSMWDDYLNNASLVWAIAEGIDPMVEGNPDVVSSLRASFHNAVKLTEDQKRLLCVYAKEVEEGRQQLVILNKYLNGMKAHNDWVTFNSVDAVAEGFRSLIEEKQNKQFCSFLTRNTAVVSSLMISNDAPLTRL